MIGLTYKDTIWLIDPVVDNYGGEKIGRIEQVPALFIERTGYSHTNNRDEITSDGEVYIDPTNAFVIEVANRLEGMLLLTVPFGGDDDDAWYRITNVTVGQDKLLTNQIDNIRLQLKKTVGIPYVS